MNNYIGLALVAIGMPLFSMNMSKPAAKQVMPKQELGSNLTLISLVDKCNEILTEPKCFQTFEQQQSVQAINQIQSLLVLLNNGTLTPQLASNVNIFLEQLLASVDSGGTSIQKITLFINSLETQVRAIISTTSHPQAPKVPPKPTKQTPPAFKSAKKSPLKKASGQTATHKIPPASKKVPSAPQQPQKKPLSPGSLAGYKIGLQNTGRIKEAPKKAAMAHRQVPSAPTKSLNNFLPQKQGGMKVPPKKVVLSKGPLKMAPAQKRPMPPAPRQAHPYQQGVHAGPQLGTYLPGNKVIYSPLSSIDGNDTAKSSEDISEDIEEESSDNDDEKNQDTSKALDSDDLLKPDDEDARPQLDEDDADQAAGDDQTTFDPEEGYNPIRKDDYDDTDQALLDPEEGYNPSRKDENDDDDEGAARDDQASYDSEEGYNPIRKDDCDDTDQALLDPEEGYNPSYQDNNDDRDERASRNNQAPLDDEEGYSHDPLPFTQGGFEERSYASSGNNLGSLDSEEGYNASAASFSYIVEPQQGKPIGGTATSQSSHYNNDTPASTPNNAPNSAYSSTPGLNHALSDGAKIVIQQNIPSQVDPNLPPNTAYITTPGLDYAAHHGATFITTQVDTTSAGSVPNSAYYVSPGKSAVYQQTQIPQQTNDQAPGSFNGTTPVIVFPGPHKYQPNPVKPETDDLFDEIRLTASQATAPQLDTQTPVTQSDLLIDPLKVSEAASVFAPSEESASNSTFYQRFEQQILTLVPDALGDEFGDQEEAGQSVNFQEPDFSNTNAAVVDESKFDSEEGYDQQLEEEGYTKLPIEEESYNNGLDAEEGFAQQADVEEGSYKAPAEEGSYNNGLDAEEGYSQEVDAEESYYNAPAEEESYNNGLDAEEGYTQQADAEESYYNAPDEEESYNNPFRDEEGFAQQADAEEGYYNAPAEDESYNNGLDYEEGYDPNTYADESYNNGPAEDESYYNGFDSEDGYAQEAYAEESYVEPDTDYDYNDQYSSNVSGGSTYNQNLSTEYNWGSMQAQIAQNAFQQSYQPAYTPPDPYQFTNQSYQDTYAPPQQNYQPDYSGGGYDGSSAGGGSVWAAK